MMSGKKKYEAVRYITDIEFSIVSKGTGNVRRDVSSMHKRLYNECIEIIKRNMTNSIDISITEDDILDYLYSTFISIRESSDINISDFFITSQHYGAPERTWCVF